MSDDIFGPVEPDSVIENLLLDQLKLWLPTYLKLLERRLELSFAIKPPTSWGIPEARFEKWPEQMTPHVAVVSGGIEGKPVEHSGPEGRREYHAIYTFETTVVVSASTPKAVEKLAKLYIAAVELVLNKHPVGDPVEEIEWRGHSPETYSGSDDKRSMVAMTARWGVLAAGVMNRWPGLDEPLEDPSDPPADWPLIETAELTVEPRD